LLADALPETPRMPFTPARVNNFETVGERI
jgi:hypothetical protein